MIKKATQSAGSSFTGTLAADLLPGTAYTYTLGNSTYPWQTGHINDTYTNSVRNFNTGVNLTLWSYTTDGAAAVAAVIDTTSTFANASAKLLSVKNNGTQKCFLNTDGELELTTVSKGIILKSADGTRYRLIIANGGTVSISAA